MLKGEMVDIIVKKKPSAEQGAGLMSFGNESLIVKRYLHK